MVEPSKKQVKRVTKKLAYLLKQYPSPMVALLTTDIVINTKSLPAFYNTRVLVPGVEYKQRRKRWDEWHTSFSAVTASGIHPKVTDAEAARAWLAELFRAGRYTSTSWTLARRKIPWPSLSSFRHELARHELADSTRSAEEDERWNLVDDISVGRIVDGLPWGEDEDETFTVEGVIRIIPWVGRLINAYHKRNKKWPDFDWMEALAAALHYVLPWAEQEKPDLLPLTVAQAAKAYDKWKADQGASKAGTVIYRWDDGWTAQLLTRKGQLVEEGKILDHCIGKDTDYWRRVKDFAEKNAGYGGRDPNDSLGRGGEVAVSIRNTSGTPVLTLWADVIDRPDRRTFHFADVYGDGNRWAGLTRGQFGVASSLYDRAAAYKKFLAKHLDRSECARMWDLLAAFGPSPGRVVRGDQKGIVGMTYCHDMREHKRRKYVPRPTSKLKEGSVTAAGMDLLEKDGLRSIERKHKAKKKKPAKGNPSSRTVITRYLRGL